MTTFGQRAETSDIKRLFDVLKANVIRSRKTVAVVFIAVQDRSALPAGLEQEAESDLTELLGQTIRQSDLLFKLGPRFTWCLMLSQSGEEEASAFISRCFRLIQEKAIPLLQQYELPFSASVAEIGNDAAEFETMLDQGLDALASAIELGPWQLTYIDAYKQKKTEQIKVSILEDDGIIRNMLKVSLENIRVPGYELEIRTFANGQEYLQSDWFLSSHTHLIIMEDILPRKNGLEVLDVIRSLPNQEKFIVYMMTKRKSEEDMIHAYENGVDEYLAKPFNLRLFEAQIQRSLARLWS